MRYCFKTLLISIIIIVVQKKQVEEIIAEDYDNTNPDAYNHPTAKNENIWSEKLKRRFTQTKDEESVKGNEINQLR